MKKLFVAVLTAMTLATAVPALAADEAESAAAAQTVVNINTAGVEELQVLPGVGEVTAERILAYRAENGTFAQIEDLTEVRGIGTKTLEKIRPMVVIQ
jgi:competence protein ComEA